MSNFDESAAWSEPRVTTSGQITSRAKDIANEWTAHGSKPRIFGYMSIGESVPEVITTDWNRSKTGLIAIDASLQQNWKSGSCTCGGKATQAASDAAERSVPAA